MRHLQAVLDRDVVRVGACSAASSRCPARSSTHARPQSARALRGSSRSCHSRYSRSSSARASADGSVLTIACVASWTSRSPPIATREVRRDRSSRVVRPGGAPEPGEDGMDGAGSGAERLVVELLRELQRGPGVVGARPEAVRPCEAAVDRRPKRWIALASRSASPAARRSRRRRPSSARSTSASARHGPVAASARSGCRERPGMRPLARGLVCARGGERPASTLVGRGAAGVSRRACSASSAATAGAPRARASGPTTSSSSAATAGSGASRESADVPRALERVVDDGRDPGMDVAPSRRPRPR